MSGKKEQSKIAVIRIRGDVDVRRDIRETLRMLHLRRVNWAIVVDLTPAYKGMINKVKDFVTWGEIDDKLFTSLLAKWGRKSGDKRLEKNEAEEFARSFLSGKKSFEDGGIKPYFKLHPPSKGHSRGGIKQHVSIGGSLGYRGDGINDLLARMAGLKKKDGAKE